MASRFYVTGQLGTDSVSEHFVALDASTKTGKPAEFRVLRYRRELCARPEFIAALEAEVAAELPLQHPNVLHLAGAGVWDQCAFLAYERTDSVTLAQVLRATGRQPVDVAVVAAIATQALDALAHAHSGQADPGSRRPQVFQCAFTSDAVEITRAGVVKVRCFGAPAGAQRPGFRDQILGRTAYLAPQLLDGQRSTPQTDLFSLGVLLWELTTGQPLFRKPSPEESAAAVRTREVPQVSSIIPLVPADFDSFVARLLIRDPAFQFKDATAAKSALEKAVFAAEMKADAHALAGWAKPAARAEAPAAAGARKVIAEIVASRDLARAIAGGSSGVEEAADTAPRPKGPAKVVAPPLLWEKGGGATIVLDEAEPPPEPRKLPKGVLVAVLALLVLGAAGAGAWIFFPDYLSPHAALGAVVSWFAGNGRPAGERNIPAAFAWRNRDEGQVHVQGLRQDTAENFFVACGETGERCHCDLLLAADDAKPAARAPVRLSRKYNYVACEAPEGVTAMFVRVIAEGERPAATNALQIQRNLSWADVLGTTLLKQRIRWVSRYECERTFLEGEGVHPTDGTISCQAGQHLGVLTASYHYYRYTSDEGQNEPGKNEDFKSAVCGVTSLAKVSCQSGDFPLQFGLYREEAAPFLVPVSLYRAASGDDSISVVGYAASPDSRGGCPIGTSLVKHWVAELPSLHEKSEGGPGLPTNFTNRTGELDDHVYNLVEPRAFVVTRRPSRTPCDGKGDCALSAFDDPRPAVTIPYRANGDLCVIDASFRDAAMATTSEKKSFGATAEAVPEAAFEIRTEMPAIEVKVNGKKVPVQLGKVKLPLHRELLIEVSSTGYLPQKLKVAPLEATTPQTLEVPTVKVQTGTVDLDSFPRSDVTFWRGDEKVFSGPTPVKETLPAGTYRVRFKSLRSGKEVERSVLIQDGKNTVVDQSIPD